MRGSVWGLFLLLSLATPRAAFAQTVPGPTPAGAPQQGAAQERRDELLEARRARLAELEQATPSAVVETLATVENRGFDRYISFQRGNFRFGFGKISPVSSVAPAIQWAKPSLAGTSLKARVAGSVSVLGYQTVAAQLGVFDQTAPPDFVGDGFLGAPFEFDSRSSAALYNFAYGNVAYRKFPREEFFGLGPDSTKEARSDYRFEEGVAELAGGVQPFRWLALQARAGYMTTRVGPGSQSDLPSAVDAFDAADVPGLTAPADFLRTDAGVYLSWEGDPTYPAIAFGVRYARFDDLDDNDFSFDRMSADLRGEVPLGSRQRRLAGRVYTSNDFADPGARVPFYLMKTLGGHDRLRGFRNFRFRDRNVLLLSSEYRWEANPGVELAVFYDAGKVYADLADRNFDDLESTWGFGVRFRSLRRTSFRVDVGRSREGALLYFAFGPAF